MGLFGADRDKTTVCDPPDDRVTLLTFKLAFGAAPPPCVTSASRVTLPENPLRLAILMVVFIDDPAGIVAEDSLASSEKSFGPLTIREAVTE